MRKVTLTILFLAAFYLLPGKAVFAAWYSATSPIGNAIISNFTPTFTWNADTTGMTYNSICLWNSSNCPGNATYGCPWSPSLSARSFTLPMTLSPNSSYSWVIYGCGSGCAGSGCQNFRTPACVRQSTPASPTYNGSSTNTGVSLTPLLGWTQSSWGLPATGLSSITYLWKNSTCSGNAAWSCYQGNTNTTAQVGGAGNCFQPFGGNDGTTTAPTSLTSSTSYCWLTLVYNNNCSPSYTGGPAWPFSTLACPAAQSCPTACHTDTQTVPNGSCGTTSCPPNNPPAQTCPTTCHNDTQYVPNGSCGQTTCLPTAASLSLIHI